MPHPNLLTPPPFLSFDMSKTLNEMLPVKKGQTLYFDRLYGGTPKPV